jgi:hypothetical protein
MNRQEHTFLLAERSTLRGLLEATSPDAVLVRSGLEARLDEVQEQLAAAGSLRDEEAESRLTFRGEFLGVLPDSRTFEFRLADSNEVVRGKVGLEIADPDVINRHLHQPVTIDVLAMRVAGGRLRYALNALPTWQD